MKRILAAAFCLVSIAITGNATFAQSGPAVRPVAGSVPKAVFPEFTEATLKNGLRVVIVEDHRQPVIYIRTLIMSGGASDVKHIGSSGAVAALLQKGTTTRSADEIARKIDFYGSSIAAGASSDDVNIFTSILTKDIDQVLPIYADVIEHPVFPQDELAKYVSNKLAELKQSRQDPSYPGRMMGRKLAFGEHPYGAVETEESVNALTTDVLKKWHDKNFGPNNAVIAINGDVTKSEIMPILEKYFGEWKPVTPDKPQYPVLNDIKGTPIVLIDRPGSVQSSIRLERLGLRRGDALYDRASFIASVFAGNGNIGFGNRLFQNIREKHGYTYTPGGSLTSSIDRGVLVAIAEVRNAVTDSALDQMLYEYRRLSTEEIPADELAMDKSIVTGSFLMSLANPSTTSSNLLEIMEYNLPKDYFQTYAARINALSASELKSVAARVYSPNDIAIIVTGDAKEIKPKLARFGDVAVYDVDLKPASQMAYAPSDLTLDKVLDKFYAALGKPALEKVNDRTTEADVEITFNGQSMPGKLTSVEAVPNKKYEKLSLTFGTMQNWVDGEHVWQQQGPKSAELTGDDLKRELADAEFSPELKLGDANHKLGLLGSTTLKSGEDAYVLSLEKPNTNPEKWYISKKSGLLVQREVASPAGMTVMSFGDYRPVDGVMVPYSIALTGAQDLQLTVTSVKQNTHPDPAMFQKK